MKKKHVLAILISLCLLSCHSSTKRTYSATDSYNDIYSKIYSYYSFDSNTKTLMNIEYDLDELLRRKEYWMLSEYINERYATPLGYTLMPYATEKEMIIAIEMIKAKAVYAELEKEKEATTQEKEAVELYIDSLRRDFPIAFRANFMRNNVYMNEYEKEAVRIAENAFKDDWMPKVRTLLERLYEGTLTNNYTSLIQDLNILIANDMGYQLDNDADYEEIKLAIGLAKNKMIASLLRLHKER